METQFTVDFADDSTAMFARYIAEQESGPHGVGNWLHDIAIERMAGHPLTRMCANPDCFHVHNPTFEEVDSNIVATPAKDCEYCGCAVRTVEAVTAMSAVLDTFGG